MTYRINTTIVLDSNPNLSNISNLVSTGTGFFKIPAGNTAQRPVSPEAGMIRYNTSNNKFEVYTTTWNESGTITNSLPFSPKRTIIQSKNGSQSTSSNTFVDITDLSTNITPTSTSSKIRVTSAINFAYYVPNGARNFVAELALFRDSTRICTKIYESKATGISFGTNTTGQNIMFDYTDLPNTTASTNYSFKFRIFSNVGAFAYINSDLVISTTLTVSTMVVEEYTY